MTRIYLSYRPEDSSAKEADLLYKELVQVHGEHAILRTPRQETRLVTQIQDEVNACQVVLVMIGSYWELIVDEHGRSVLEDRYDHIHVEIATALKNKKQILPVLVDDAKMPDPLNLPLVLRRLTAVEPVSLRTGLDFDADAKKLARDLRNPSSVIKVTKQAPAASPSPTRKSSSRPLMLGGIVFMVITFIIGVLMIEESGPIENVVNEIPVVVTNIPAPQPTATNTAQYRPDDLSLSDQAITLDNASGLGRQVSLPAHANGVTAVAFSPDGTLMASGGSDGLINIWSMEDMSRVTSFALQIWRIADLDFNATSTRIAYTAYQDLVYYNLDTERSSTYPLKVASTFVDFHPNSAALVAGWTETSVAIWDTSGDSVSTKEPIVLDTGRNIPVRSAVFSPDGSKLLVGEANGRIQVWHLNVSGYALTAAHESAVTTLAFSPDGSKFAAASEDGLTIRIWETDTLRLLKIITGRYTVSDIAFNADGTLLFVAAKNGNLYLWGVDEATYTMVNADSESLHSLAISPDGALLATAGESLQIWSKGE